MSTASFAQPQINSERSLVLGPHSVEHTVKFTVSQLCNLQHARALQTLEFAAPTLGGSLPSGASRREWSVFLIEPPRGDRKSVPDIHLEDFAVLKDGVWTINLPGMLCKAMGKSRPTQVSKNLPADLGLEFTLKVTEEDIVHQVFHPMEHAYLLHANVNRRRFDRLAVEMNMDDSMESSMNWWRRHVSPWLAVLKYKQRRRYDIGLPDADRWHVDHMRGTAKVTFDDVEHPSPLVIPVYYRYTSVDNPLGIVASLAHWAYRLAHPH